MPEAVFDTEDSAGDMDRYYIRKHAFGVKMPDGAGEDMTAGEVVAEIAAGMFWPIATDNSTYTMGGSISVRLGADIKLDFGGDINWGLMGIGWYVQGGREYKFNFEEDEWAVWAVEGLISSATSLGAKLQAVANRHSRKRWTTQAKAAQTQLQVQENNTAALTLAQAVKNSL